MQIKRFPKLDGDIGWFELCIDKEQNLGKRLKGDIESEICIVGGGGSQALVLQTF